MARRLRRTTADSKRSATFVPRDEIARLASAAVRVDHRRFRADLDTLIDQGT
jgi:hypothetical protein